MTNPQPPLGELPQDPFERNGGIERIAGPDVDALYAAAKTAWESNEGGDPVLYLATLSGQLVAIKRAEVHVGYDGIGHPIANGFRRLFGKYDRDAHAPVIAHYSVEMTSATNTNERKAIFVVPGRDGVPSRAYAEREIFAGTNELPAVYRLDDGRIVDDTQDVSYGDRIHEFTEPATTAEIAAEATACIESGTQISAEAVLEGRQLGPNSKVFGAEAIDLYESIGAEVLVVAGLTHKTFARSSTAIIVSTVVPGAGATGSNVDRIYMDRLDRMQNMMQIKLHNTEVQVHILTNYGSDGRISNCMVKYVIPERHGLAQTPVELSPADRLALHGALKRQITRNNLTRVKSWA